MDLPLTGMQLRNWLGLAACLALAGPPAAYANAPENVTPGEVARLPAFCPDTFSFTRQWAKDSPTPRQAYWQSLVGTTFWAMHHYCWGLIAAHRSMAPGVSPALREHLLYTAIRDLQYVINEAPPDWVLLPELYTRIGDYFERRGRYAEAMESQQKAMSLKADYWPPYAALISLQARLGKRTVAEQVLVEGLTRMPGQPQIIAAGKRAGLAIPAKLAIAAPPPASAAASSAAAAATASSAPGAVEPAASAASAP